MLIDSPTQPSLFAPAYTDLTQDMSDFFHTELFGSAPSLPSPSHSQSSGSRESTPNVLTPPQPIPAASFPDIHDGSSPTPSFFNFLDEDVKCVDPLAMLSSAPYDFFGAFPLTGGGGAGASSSFDINQQPMMAIDPQLVDSPATLSFSDFDSDNATSPASPVEEPLPIAPVKVGGHGKARKGTVAGGGVKKASASVSAAESKSSVSLASTAFMPSTTFKPRATKTEDDEDGDDQDDLPADWRPPPEVFQKMTSKEKRQLRNKISARNFRVRRKEYISTLEDNIAERDRLLSAIRSELGSTQSENLALRQEIATLKKTLLEGRGPAPVLPPPAPLQPLSPPASSVSSPNLTSDLASPIASSSTGRSSPLPRANINKDLGATSTRFWGGVGSPLSGMGGYTSVHTARIPDLLGASPFAASPFAPVAEHPQVPQENLNPALNPSGKVSEEVVRAGFGLGSGTGAPGADAFGDANPFTVRNLDAYRMHLWGRMAAQYKLNKEKEHAASSAPAFNGLPMSPFTNKPQFTGLANGLKPKYFASPTLGPNSVNGLATSLSGLSLSGKHVPVRGSSAKEREHTIPAPPPPPASQKEREAMYAAMASQTLLKRLGGAFWDAFSGNERASSSSSSSSSIGNGQKWDPEKVRKVLDGTAVVRVVDVEPSMGGKSPKISAAAAVKEKDSCGGQCASKLHDVLEESMRSLSLGKK
ncbi:hypothetical protein FB45DRAFT_907411 [Roridomyces roridus]|uniref:BZIP domain-containing protein n=1 Tax=Roridomyces roridus TaxID=1738132 RepID=A0AAD7C1U7_9AGAR|nr:hypothetical protein FB45DRAFT_907411 [Roridomyces roridus]